MRKLVMVLALCGPVNAQTAPDADEWMRLTRLAFEISEQLCDPTDQPCLLRVLPMATVLACAEMKYFLSDQRRECYDDAVRAYAKTRGFHLRMND